jgi:flagellar hook-associated protein 2
VSTSSSGLSTVLTNVNNAFSGKTSGIDVAGTVSALMQLQEQPGVLMQSQQSAVQLQISTLGTIASQLSQLQTDVQSLTDVFGALSQKTVTSSDPTIATATAQNTAVSGTHSVVVSQLATVSSSYSDPIADPTTLNGTTLTINYGDPKNPSKTDSITLPNTIKTLQDVANAINGSASNTGVTASVQNDTNGQRLVLVSKASGAAGNLTVSGGVKFNQGVTGQDATGSVDGVPFDSASNTLTGVISGVNLQLASSAPGTTVQIGITPDTTTAATALTNFVTDYNTVMQTINAQFSADSSGNLGPLEADPSLRALQTQMLQLAGDSASGVGKYVNLQSLGVEMQNDGTLQLNTSTLDTALTTDYADFQNFFQSTAPAGYGQAISKMLQQMTDPTAGAVGLDTQGLKSENNNLTQQINDFQDQMTVKQQQLTAQYSSLNVLLQQYPAEMQQIELQLSSLNSSSSSSNS